MRSGSGAAQRPKADGGTVPSPFSNGSVLDVATVPDCPPRLTDRLPERRTEGPRDLTGCEQWGGSRD